MRWPWRHIVSDNKRDVGVALNGQLLDTDSEPVILDWLGLADKDINSLSDAIYTNALLKVDKLTIGIRRLAGAVRSAKPYDDYHRHTIELMRLEHEIAFEAKCQQEMEKEMDLIEEQLTHALKNLDRTAKAIHDAIEENIKKEDDAWRDILISISLANPKSTNLRLNKLWSNIPTQVLLRS